MKGSLVSIDPGENTGGAYFVDGELIWCGLLNLLDGSHTAMRPDKLAIEVMYIRPDDMKGERAEVAAKKLNDLLSVNLCAGQWIHAVSAPYTRRLFPHQWKGGLSKERHAPRILGALSNAEQARLPKGMAASKIHNVIDAIGIGLFELGRTTRGGR